MYKAGENDFELLFNLTIYYFVVPAMHYLCGDNRFVSPWPLTFGGLKWYAKVSPRINRWAGILNANLSGSKTHLSYSASGEEQTKI